jgi:hypothetical protein
LNVDRGLATGFIALAVLLPSAALDQRRTLCPIRRVTGLPCPACGLTRSVHAASRFRLRESVGFHPLGIPTLGAGVLFATGRLRLAERGDRSSAPFIVGAVVWVLTWMVRLANARRPASAGRAAYGVGDD